MAEPSSPEERALELEKRRGPSEPAPSRDVAPPLALERWAIALRRTRAGYVGYEATESTREGFARVDRTTRAPGSSLIDRLWQSLDAFKRRRRPHRRSSR